MPRRATTPKLTRLPTFDPESGDLNAVVEATRGSRNKFKYDEVHGLFVLHGVLPAGSSFPFDFGFVPQTIGDDGDPLDVLVLMDEPAFPGAVVPSQLIGVIEALQRRPDEEAERNDRLIAVARKAHQYGDANALEDLPSHLVAEIEEFFVSYNRVKGVEFTPIGRGDADRARALVEAGAA